MPQNSEPNASPQPLDESEQRVQAAIDSVVHENLRPVAFGLAVIYLATGALDLLLLADPPKQTLSLTAFATATLLAAVAIWLRRERRLVRWSHAVATGLALIVLLNSLLRIYLTGETVRSTSLLLLLLGGAFILVALRWFMLLLVATLAGWWLVIWQLGELQVSAQLGFALLAAAVLALVIRRTHSQTLRSFERVRLHEQQWRDELGTALNSVEQSEERFRMLSEASFEGVAVHDRGTLTEANSALGSMLGVAYPELLGRNLLDFVARPASDQPEDVILKPGTGLGQVTLLRQDRSTFPAEIRGREIPHNGQRLQVMVIRDLSDRKKLEEERERFFTLSLDILCIADFDGYFKRLNPVSERILGYPMDELLAEPFLSFVHPEDQQKTIDAMGDLSGGADVIAFENRYRCQDGSYKWILWNARPSVEDQLIYAVGRDITNRKRIEERLHLASTALEAAANAVAITDTEGNIGWVNPAFTRLTGYGSEEIQGKNPRILKSGEHGQDFYAKLWKTILAGEVWQGEIVNRRKDGSLYFEEQTIAPVQDESGQIVNFIGIKQDVSARKRAEEAQAKLEEELRQANDRLEERVLERTRELEQAQAQLLAQQRLQQELELAQEIQGSLLPSELPSIDGFQFSARAVPARYVSGDLYDFSAVESGGCHLFIADIAGKGIPAALLTSTARTFLRAQFQLNESPAVILDQVNQSLFEDLRQAEMFITIMSARLDPKLATLRYANAGHTQTIWWRSGSGSFETLPATGIPVGILESLDAEEAEIKLKPGDCLAFYSDGITEAANPESELFGEQRLLDVLAEHVDQSADRIAQAITDEIDRFRLGAALSDDLTLIILKALPRTVRFSFPASLDHLYDVTGIVKSLSSAYGQEFAYQMELVASEVATNIIRHAYRQSEGDVRGEVQLGLDGVVLELFDRGTSFDPSGLQLPELGTEQEGGFGLHIVQELTDELEYTPNTSEGNLWRLAKRSTRSE